MIYARHAFVGRKNSILLKFLYDTYDFSLFQILFTDAHIHVVYFCSVSKIEDQSFIFCIIFAFFALLRKIPAQGREEKMKEFQILAGKMENRTEKEERD